MNEDTIRQIIKEEISKFSMNSQYTVSNIPLHVHNGLDSNKVHGQDIDNSNFMTWGTAVVDGSGNYTIVNQNIRAASTILVTGTVPTDTFLITGICITGQATISNASAGEMVSYLIIF